MLCLVQFVDVLGVTEVITALPRMLAGLGAPVSSGALILTGYAMCFGGFLMPGARLGDRYGYRRVLLTGIALFAAGALLAAAASSVPGLVSGQCLQGVAAALAVPAALRLLIAATPDARTRRRALAAWSAAGAAAGACGYLLGGLLTDLAGWRAMFFLDLLLAGLLAAGTLSARPVPGQRSTRLDLAGSLLLTSAVASLVVASSLLQQPRCLVPGLVVAGLGGSLALVLVRFERRQASPLLAPVLVRHPKLRAGAGAAFLNTATTSPAGALAALHLQMVQHASPVLAGVELLPFSLGVAGGSSLAPRLLRRRPHRIGVAAGLGVIAAGDAILLAVGVASWLLPAGISIAGLGLGLSSVAATGAGTDVPAGAQGTAAGALNTAAQLGTAIGVGALLLLATDTSRTTAPLRGIPLGWAAAATIAAAGAILLARTGRRRTSRPARDDDMQTVTLGAAKLEATPIARAPRAGGGRAL